MPLAVLLVEWGAALSCEDVPPWQMLCQAPNIRDPLWRRAMCKPGNYWEQPCEVYDEISCDGSKNVTLRRWCPQDGGARYGVAVVLSFALGWLGIDRFYLGYPALGLLKMMTCGIFGLGWMIDAALVVAQVIGPADGRGYRVVPGQPIFGTPRHQDVL